MRLLGGFRVVQIGDGLAAAVCGRLLADVGADVSCVDPDKSTPLADYLTINVSSPNTPGLRDLQRREALDELIARVVDARDETEPRRPLMLQIAPDLDARGLEDIGHLADPIGTVLFPLLAFVSNLPLIGWAKPVPVDVRRLRHQRRDYVLVAAAGPASNLVLAVAAALLLRALPISPVILGEPPSRRCRPDSRASRKQYSCSENSCAKTRKR